MLNSLNTNVLRVDGEVNGLSDYSNANEDNCFSKDNCTPINPFAA